MKNLTLCPLSFLSPARSLVSRDEILSRCSTSRKLPFPLREKNYIHPSSLFEKIFNTKKKKIREISRKIISPPPRVFWIEAIRCIFIPRLPPSPLYNRNNTLRREEGSRRKKRKRTRLSFATLLSLGYFEGPLVCGVVALNRDLDSLLEAGCCKFSDRELFFDPG